MKFCTHIDLVLIINEHEEFKREALKKTFEGKEIKVVNLQKTKLMSDSKEGAPKSKADS